MQRIWSSSRPLVKSRRYWNLQDAEVHKLLPAYALVRLAETAVYQYVEHFKFILEEIYVQLAHKSYYEISMKSKPEPM